MIKCVRTNKISLRLLTKLVEINQIIYRHLIFNDMNDVLTNVDQKMLHTLVLMSII